MVAKIPLKMPLVVIGGDEVNRLILESWLFVLGINTLPYEGVNTGDVGLAMQPEVVNVARVVEAKSGHITTSFLTCVGSAVYVRG